MAEMLQPFVVQSREKLTEHEAGGESSASMKLARFPLAQAKGRLGGGGLTDMAR